MNDNQTKQLFFELLKLKTDNLLFNGFEDFWKFYKVNKNRLPANLQIIAVSTDEELLKNTFLQYYNDMIQPKELSESEMNELVKRIKKERKNNLPPEIYDAITPKQNDFQITDENISLLRKNFKDRTGMTVIEFLKKLGIS